VDNISVELYLEDTPSQEDFDRLRPLSYPDTSVFILLFSLENVQSVERIANRWIPEITYHVPNAKYIFVGNKIDLWNENESENEFDTKAMKSAIQELKEKYPQVSYIEISCYQKVNLVETVDLAIREALKSEIVEKKKDGCTIQ
jgi:Ras-related C3 botulinum toxin substrate 1